MTSRMNGSLLLTLVALLTSGTSTFADPQAGNAPVVITDQDLNSLSPEARREIQALIQHKQENPDPEPTRIRFGKNRGIVGGDIGPGGVDIQLLGGAFKSAERINVVFLNLLPSMFPTRMISFRRLNHHDGQTRSRTDVYYRRKRSNQLHHPG